MLRGGLKRTVRTNPTSVLTGSVLDALCTRALQFPHCAWEAAGYRPTLKTEGSEGQGVKSKRATLEPQDLVEVCHLRICFSFPISPVWKENVPPLNSGNWLLVWFQRFIAGGEFYLVMNHTLCLIMYLMYMVSRWYLEVEILDFMLKWMKMFGTVGMEWMHSACEKGMNLWGRGETKVEWYTRNTGVLPNSYMKL